MSQRGESASRWSYLPNSLTQIPSRSGLSLSTKIANHCKKKAGSIALGLCVFLKSKWNGTGVPNHTGYGSIRATSFRHKHCRMCCPLAGRTHEFTHGHLPAFTGPLENAPPPQCGAFSLCTGSGARG